jgi:hypothetical protein
MTVAPIALGFFVSLIACPVGSTATVQEPSVEMGRPRVSRGDMRPHIDAW